MVSGPSTKLIVGTWLSILIQLVKLVLGCKQKGDVYEGRKLIEVHQKLFCQNPNLD